MKKIFKKEVIIAFIVGILLASSVAGFASINASQIDYKNNQKVSDALDDLYTNFRETSDNEKEITEAGQQTLDKYYKNLNVNIPNNLAFTTGSFTSVAGDNTISIGFVPNKLFIMRSDVPTLVAYQSEFSTTWYLYMAGTTKNIFKVQLGGNSIWQVTPNNDFSASSDMLGTYLKSVGTNSVMYTGTAGVQFDWIAYS